MIRQISAAKPFDLRALLKVVFLSKFPGSLLALWAEVDGSHLFAFLYYTGVIRLLAELINPLQDFRILKGKCFLGGSRFLSHRPDPSTLLPPPLPPTMAPPTPRDPRSQLSIQDCGVPHLPSSSCLQSLCAWRRWGGPLQVPRTPGSPANVPLPGLGGLWRTSLEDGLRYTDPPPRAVAWSEGSHLQAAET